MMKQTIREETVLFASVIKWLILASFTGVVVGLGATAFLVLLHRAIRAADQYPYIFLLLPLAMFLSALMVKYLSPEAEGVGTEKVIEAIHRHSSVVPLAVVPVKIAATILTIAIGGSAGKVAPSAQIGAALASFFARLFKFEEADRRKLVICGISAGFSTVLGAPIAGAIFGIEVLFIGSLLYEVLLPSFIAGVTAYQVSVFFGVPYFNFVPPIIPAINEAVLLKVIVAAMIFGLVSIVLIKGMQAGHDLSARLRIWQPAKGLVGGLLLAPLAFILGRQHLGLGLDTISSCLNGQEAAWYSPLAKVLFTAITLNFGGSGGIITPIFFIGATAGAFVAEALRMDTAMMSAIGMVSLLAGAANTPIAASILALELFGPAIGPYAAVACIVSYLITGHRSIYPTQILTIRKSSSLVTETGMEIQAIHPEFQKRGKTITGLLVAVWNKIVSAFSKRKA